MSDPPQTPAFGQGAATVADMTESWPRLPDGRVVITIYGVRLAVPTCAACLRDFQFWGDQAVGVIRMRTAIAEPRRLREMIAGASRMTLTTGNSWTPDISLGPFLDKFDPRLLPASTRLDLNLFKKVKPLECWVSGKIPECELLHSLATQPQAPAPDGLYELPGPVAYPGPSLR